MNSNMSCPFCGETVAGIGKHFYSQYVIISCTNPECNASTHFKTSDINKAMELYAKRESRESNEMGLLRNCPFCGEPAGLYSDGNVYVAGCTTPECRGNVNDTSGGWNTPGKAIKRWNERGKHDSQRSEESNAGIQGS